MDVRAIVVNFNVRELPVGFVNSIYRSIGDLDSEIIVMEDGSQDAVVREAQATRHQTTN